MRFPMHVTTKRLVESGTHSKAEILARLDLWADRYGFARSADDAEDFIYVRGSHWHALYTFDIRKVPTQVRIRMLNDDLGTCVCTMTCGSWLQISTYGDEKRLSDELDLLAACLQGAFSPAARPAETRIAPERDRHTGSQDIQS